MFNGWMFSRLDEFKKKRTIRYEPLGALALGKTSYVLLKRFRTEEGKARSRFVVVPMVLEDKRWMLDVENAGAFLIEGYDGA
jgi:hypothetical protein